MRGWMKGACIALGMLMAGSSAVAAECADHISGGPDNPITGTLNDTETRSYSVSITGKSPYISGGGSYSVSYRVGYYQMSDGSVIVVDCRTYQQVR